MFYRMVIVCFFVLIAGCSLHNQKMYDGQLMDESEHAVISALGLYPKLSVAIQIIEINSKPVDIFNSASFLLLPGEHSLKLKTKRDAHTESSHNGLSLIWKEYISEVKLNVNPGHTYIPEVQIIEDKVIVSLKDMGFKYPIDCLPAYRASNNLSDPQCQI